MYPNQSLRPSVVPPARKSTSLFKRPPTSTPSPAQPTVTTVFQNPTGVIRSTPANVVPTSKPGTSGSLFKPSPKPSDPVRRSTSLFKRPPNSTPSPVQSTVTAVFQKPTAVPQAIPPRLVRPTPTKAAPKPVTSGSLFKPRPVPPKPAAKSSPDTITQLTYSDEQRARLSLNSYIGPYGYTTLKSALTPLELTQIKEDSTISPVSSGFTGTSVAPRVPLYRETDTKLYLPPHYGYTLFGPASASSLGPGDTWGPCSSGDAVPYTLPLKENQKVIVDTIVTHLRTQISKARIAGALLQAGCGVGKTAMGIRIAWELGKKTIVWVEKGFLADQWTDEIKKMCPGARIGRIQGDVFDIEDKHFVLAMVQTVYSRIYPIGTFSSFGMTIIDEAHSLCSNEYFKVLQTVVTPYSLAVTARFAKPNEMDTIMYRFLGPITYAAELKEVDHRVTVRTIKYSHPDEEYNRVETDFKGRVKYSSLITRITTFEPRIDFLVNLAIEHMREHPEGQLFVLSFTKDLLVQIHKKLEAYSDPVTGEKYSSGLYVGGMKKEALAATAAKQIVLATYSMAQEALNIPTLDSIIFASPKSDLLQSLGRIMRIIHDNKYVYDITDSHSVFVTQSRKRNAIYRANGYLLYSAKSDAYRGRDTRWHTVYIPKKQKDRMAHAAHAAGEEKGEGSTIPGTEDSDSDSNEEIVDEDEFDHDSSKPVTCLFEDADD